MIPLELPADATALLLLVHIPAGVLLLSVAALPWHMVATPVVGVGKVIFTKAPALQPAAEV